MEKIIAEKGYLYSLWSGRLIVYEGQVVQSYFDETLGKFRSKTKSHLCSLEPGTEYQAVVWLLERNDEMAKKIMIEYEQLNIEKLQEKIKNHQNKIKILEEA